MIQYREAKSFCLSQLTDLFMSVGWGYGKNPEQLISALGNSDKVVSAWDDDRLIGLVNALSDGVRTVYFHYVLIHGEYQGRGIGKAMMNKIMEKYQHCRHMVLISNNAKIGFFTKCGFETSQGASSMEIRRRG
ncbi:MAG: putative acetyltransferase [Syntrophorhabdus sp. PtaU1.Bin002]|nr:MAG: putative acetyltransferase [Syntrophorhabdus sp. PtaU1.Bin002]